MSEQADRALALANSIRMSRADCRRRLGGLDKPTALRQAAVVASHPDRWALTWSVYGLLAAVPGIGPVKAYQVLRRCSIPDAGELCDLDHRQRHALCAWLEDRARTLDAGRAAA